MTRPTSPRMEARSWRVLALGAALLTSLALPAVPALAATPAASPQSLPASGRYQGSLNGVAMQLVLQAGPDRMQAVLQIEGGLPTALEGQWQSGTYAGLARNDDGTARFALQRTPDGVRVELQEPSPLGGEPVRLALDLAGPLREAAAGSTTAPQVQGGAVQGAGGDARLVGLWRYSQSYTSGGFTAVSEEFVRFEADGRCAYGAGRVMAGDANTSGDSGRGGMSPCEWRSVDRQLSLREPGGSGWRAAGRYSLDTDKGVMLQYLPDGSRRLWYRQ